MNLITPELKDLVLNRLIAFNTMDGSFNMKELATETGISYEFLDAIIDQFEKYDLFKFERASNGHVLFFCKAGAHDLFRLGGFTAREELLKKNLQKLALEIEALRPAMPDKAAVFANILGGITSAIALFK